MSRKTKERTGKLARLIMRDIPSSGYPEWAIQAHWQAIGSALYTSGSGYGSPFERAIVSMLDGWLQYADAHLYSYGTHIGDDGLLGREWEEIGDSLRRLLNGQCGRLICGALDSIILEAMKESGINVSGK